MRKPRNRMMTIRVEEYKYGGYTLRPVSRYWQEATENYLRACKDAGLIGDYETVEDTIYVDNLEIELSDKQYRDLEEGWHIHVLMDPWEWGQGYVGYDAGDNNFNPEKV